MVVINSLPCFYFAMHMRKRSGVPGLKCRQRLVRTSPEHLTRASQRSSTSLVRGTSREPLRTGRAFEVDLF